MSRLPKVFAAGDPSAHYRSLDGLHRRREQVALRFAHQEVDVLGHHDVSEHQQAVFSMGIFQRLFEHSLGPSGAQVGLSAITTKGDEVQLLRALVSPDSPRHAESITLSWKASSVMPNENPRPTKRKLDHPHEPWRGSPS
jgi:hypothetical protein